MMSSDEFKRRRSELAAAAGRVLSDPSAANHAAAAAAARALDVASRGTVSASATARPAAGLFTADVVTVTNEAIDRAERGAPAEWLAAARAAIRRAADAGGTFTADDVWAMLARDGVAEPNEPRAMGAAFRAAKAAGEIVRAGGYKAGTRPRGHGHPVSIWIRKGTPRASASGLVHGGPPTDGLDR